VARRSRGPLELAAPERQDWKAARARGVRRPGGVVSEARAQPRDALPPLPQERAEHGADPPPVHPVRVRQPRPRPKANPQRRREQVLASLARPADSGVQVLRPASPRGQVSPRLLPPEGLASVVGRPDSAPRLALRQRRDSPPRALPLRQLDSRVSPRGRPPQRSAPCSRGKAGWVALDAAERSPARFPWQRGGEAVSARAPPACQVPRLGAQHRAGPRACARESSRRISGTAF